MPSQTRGVSTPCADDLAVSPEGGRWAVKHKGGYLGLVSSEAEAWSIVRTLSADPLREARSFRPGTETNRGHV